MVGGPSSNRHSRSPRLPRTAVRFCPLLFAPRRMRPALLWTLAAALLVSLPCLTSRAEDNAQEAQPQTPPQTQPAPQTTSESYRIRITNTLYGPVEASADQGATWLLVGRVVHQAVDVAPSGPAAKTAILRSSPQGVALGVGGGKFLRLVPDAPTAHRDPTAIALKASPTSALFKELLPPVDSPVQQVVGRTAIALPEHYAPSEGDVLQITATSSALPPDKAAAAVKEAAEKYRQAALERIKAAGKKPTTGTLSVNANLHPNEKPSVITFYLDGNVVGILNSPPYSIRLNTTIWSNGEHLIEVRALDANGATLTRKKALVVVDNPPQPKTP